MVCLLNQSAQFQDPSPVGRRHACRACYLWALRRHSTITWGWVRATPWYGDPFLQKTASSLADDSRADRAQHWDITEFKSEPYITIHSKRELRRFADGPYAGLVCDLVGQIIVTRGEVVPSRVRLDMSNPHAPLSFADDRSEEVEHGAKKKLFGGAAFAIVITDLLQC